MRRCGVALRLRELCPQLPVILQGRTLGEEILVGNVICDGYISGLGIHL